MKPNDQLEPTVFVIFGGAGDLTWRKLVPALFDLSQDRSLPADFSVIPVDRVDLGDEKLRRRLHAGVKKFSRYGIVKTGAWRELPGISTTNRAISRKIHTEPSAQGSPRVRLPLAHTRLYRPEVRPVLIEIQGAFAENL